MMISDKIRLMREQCGISLRKLSQLSSYSPTLISMLENGKRQPDFEILEILKKAMCYTGVPITEEEVGSFKKELYNFYDSIKNRQLAEARKYSNSIKLSIEKCFESELKILYCLFESYLLMREYDYKKARELLEALTDLDKLTDEQRYFYYYFYAANFYEDYKKSLLNLLKAEEIGLRIHKQETNLYYSIANMYARIDYSPKSIIYGKMALDLAQQSQDKAYLTDIDATLAFEYSKIGFYQLSLDGLYGCLKRERLKNDIRGAQNTYHNLGCVYLSMQDYENALKYFDKSLETGSQGDWSYLNNKLHIVYALIYQNKKKDAEDLIDANLTLIKDMPDMRLYFESAKHSLSLDNTDSLSYIENVSIPKLLEAGHHLKAIEYMKLLTVFYGKRNSTKKSITESDKYAKMALRYTSKILKGEI